MEKEMLYKSIAYSSKYTKIKTLQNDIVNVFNIIVKIVIKGISMENDTYEFIENPLAVQVSKYIKDCESRLDCAVLQAVHDIFDQPPHRFDSKWKIATIQILGDIPNDPGTRRSYHQILYLWKRIRFICIVASIYGYDIKLKRNKWRVMWALLDGHLKIDQPTMDLDSIANAMINQRFPSTTNTTLFSGGVLNGSLVDAVTILHDFAWMSHSNRTSALKQISTQIPKPKQTASELHEIKLDYQKPNVDTPPTIVIFREPTPTYKMTPMTSKKLKLSSPVSILRKKLSKHVFSKRKNVERLLSKTESPDKMDSLFVEVTKQPYDDTPIAQYEQLDFMIK